MTQNSILWRLGHRIETAARVIAHGVAAIPERRRDIPSMITPREAAFYARCAKSAVDRSGRIVDLGCYMGSTAIALAQGLREAKSSMPAERIVAFDLFIWADWMSHRGVYGRYRPGESFLPEARRIVDDHAGDHVELRQADLTSFEWTGEPISLLLVDAMKSVDLVRQIATTFYPALQPSSLLIHQDFKHYYTSWIHILQYRLRDHFEFVHSVDESGTVAFETRIPPTTKHVALATNILEATDKEIDASFEHSLRMLSTKERCNVAAAHVAHYCHLGKRERAREVFETYRRSGMAESRGDFANVAGWLDRLE